MHCGLISNLYANCESNIIFKEIARAKGSGEEDLCTLDVHSIDELKTKGFPATNEAPKYEYEKDGNNKYGLYLLLNQFSFFLRQLVSLKRLNYKIKLN